MIESPYNLYGVYTSIYEIEKFKDYRFITIPIMDLESLNTLKEDTRDSSIFIIFFHPENPQDCEIKLKDTKDMRYKYPEVWIKSNFKEIFESICGEKSYNEEFDKKAVLQSLIKYEDEFNSTLVECIIKMFEEFKPRYDTFLMAQKGRNYLVEHPTDTLDQLVEKNKNEMEWLRKD